MVKRSRRKVLPNSWEDTPWMSEFIPGCKVDVANLSKEDMESHRRTRGRECDYVPSGIWTPSYNMNGGGLEYYFHWRDSVRRGRFIKTDMGYLRLFVSELVTFNASPKEDLPLMTRMVREYRDLNIFQMGTIGDACVCFSRLNNLPVPKVPILNNMDLVSYQTYEALKEEGIGYLSVHNLTRLFGIECELPKNVQLDRLYRRIISELDDRTRSVTGFRLCDAMLPTKRMIPVYNGLTYLGNRKSFSVEFPKELKGTGVGTSLETALRIMLVGLNVRISGRSIWDEDDLVCDIAENITQRYIDGELEFDIEDDGTFSLDPDKIEESENDLRVVSDLMHVSDDDGPVTVEDVPKVTSETLTGWEGFSASLTDEMRGYIVASLRGDVREYLRERNLRMSSVENAINTIAMDMTGDIVIEDGQPIEDYMEELKEMVGW